MNLSTLRQDLRYAVRTLLGNPGFTLVAVLSLAIGIGANTTIFTGINALLLRPMPGIEDPGRLYGVYTQDAQLAAGPLGLAPMSSMNFLDYRDQNTVFEGLVAFFGFGGSIQYDNAPVQSGITVVTANYFDVLGVTPHMGSLFRGDETTDGAHPVAVISHALWEGQLGGDPDIVGKTVLLNNFPFTIMGVAEPSFKGTQTLAGPNQLWVPRAMRANFVPPALAVGFDARRGLFNNVFGRLADGVTPMQAEEAMKLIASRLEEAYPDDNAGRSVALSPLADGAIGVNQQGNVERGSLFLLATVGLVLLIACVNIANLLLAKGSARGKEMGIRVALGAGRGRILTQLLTESLLLSVLGGALGLVLSIFGTRLLWSVRPPGLGAQVLDLSMDVRVLVFTIVVSVFTGLLFGLFPALKASTPDVQGSLKAESRGGSSGSTRSVLQQVLVVSEVALAVVALAGAGLFLRSMGKALDFDAGFDIENLLVTSSNIGPMGVGPEAGLQTYRQMVEAVDAIPGVEQSAFASYLPAGGSFMRTVIPEEWQNDPNRPRTLSHTNPVSPSYFEVMGIDLLRGRLLNDLDRADGAPVVVVNEAMAETYWPGEDPIGKRFNFIGQEVVREIVGVVNNTLMTQIGEDPQPVVFIPIDQAFQPGGSIHIRAAENAPPSVMADALTALGEVAPGAVFGFQSTARSLIDQGLWPRRITAGLLTVFGLLALALASIGLYGVMAYNTGRRRREIGIRMAMGAGTGEILKMVLRQGMGLVLLGVVIGAMAATILSGRISDFLFEVSPLDPVTFSVVPAVLCGVALAAIYFPALRASRTSPMVAFREE